GGKIRLQRHGDTKATLGVGISPGIGVEPAQRQRRRVPAWTQRTGPEKRLLRRSASPRLIQKHRAVVMELRSRRFVTHESVVDCDGFCMLSPRGKLCRARRQVALRFSHADAFAESGRLAACTAGLHPWPASRFRILSWTPPKEPLLIASTRS